MLLKYGWVRHITRASQEKHTGCETPWLYCWVPEFLEEPQAMHLAVADFPSQHQLQNELYLCNRTLDACMMTITWLHSQLSF